MYRKRDRSESQSVAEDNGRVVPLPGQGELFPLEEGASDVPPTTSPEVGTAPHPAAAESKPSGKSLISAARRSQSLLQGGRGPSRQMDITLRTTPPSGHFFRSWPEVDDYEPVYLLRVPNKYDRKDIYVVREDVARLPHVRTKVKEGKLVPCVTTIGTVFIWAMTIPDPDDRLVGPMYAALERVCAFARERWVTISWENGNKVTMEEPANPITDPPPWPTGQAIEEMYDFALQRGFIQSPDHAEILKLLTRKVEI